MQVTVEKPEPVQPPATVTITMTEEQAKDLVSFLGQIGGGGPIRDIIRELYSPIVSAFDLSAEECVQRGQSVQGLCFLPPRQE